MDKSSVIFGNPMDEKTLRKAEKAKAGFLKKFGDDTEKVYHLGLKPIDQIPELGIQNLVHSDTPLELPENALIVGNIRMGFGHYRIAMAIASCAKALGRQPVWFDLASFDATGSRMIRHQNDLYSMGSKLSQKVGLFNKLYWEPLNSEGFRQITYNAGDQKNAELLVPLFRDLPKDVPYVGTHVWPSQGAVHAGLTHVVNAIPDNWPMGLHLAEGSIHTVQTPFAYLGYKKLNGMAKTALKPMPDGDLFDVGHYIDHELVEGVEHDCEKRMERLDSGKPVRFLMTVGGAGAGGDLYLAMTRHLLPYVSGQGGAVDQLRRPSDHVGRVPEGAAGAEKSGQDLFRRLRGPESLGRHAGRGQSGRRHRLLPQGHLRGGVLHEPAHAQVRRAGDQAVGAGLLPGAQAHDAAHRRPRGLRRRPRPGAGGFPTPSSLTRPSCAICATASWPSRTRASITAAMRS